MLEIKLINKPIPTQITTQVAQTENTESLNKLEKLWYSYCESQFILSKETKPVEKLRMLGEMCALHIQLRCNLARVKLFYQLLAAANTDDDQHWFYTKYQEAVEIFTDSLFAFQKNRLDLLAQIREIQKSDGLNNVNNLVDTIVKQHALLIQMDQALLTLKPPVKPETTANSETIHTHDTLAGMNSYINYGKLISGFFGKVFKFLDHLAAEGSAFSTIIKHSGSWYAPLGYAISGISALFTIPLLIARLIKDKPKTIPDKIFAGIGIVLAPISLVGLILGLCLPAVAFKLVLASMIFELGKDIAQLIRERWQVRELKNSLLAASIEAGKLIEKIQQDSENDNLNQQLETINCQIAHIEEKLATLDSRDKKLNQAFNIVTRVITIAAMITFFFAPPVSAGILAGMAVVMIVKEVAPRFVGWLRQKFTSKKQTQEISMAVQNKQVIKNSLTNVIKNLPEKATLLKPAPPRPVSVESYTYLQSSNTANVAIKPNMEITNLDNLRAIYPDPALTLMHRNSVLFHKKTELLTKSITSESTLNTSAVEMQEVTSLVN